MLVSLQKHDKGAILNLKIMIIEELGRFQAEQLLTREVIIIMIKNSWTTKPLFLTSLQAAGKKNACFLCCHNVMSSG